MNEPIRDDKAVNGLSYTVRNTVLTDAGIYFVKKVIGQAIGSIIARRFCDGDWLKKPKSLIHAHARLQTELHAGKFSKDLSEMVMVIIPTVSGKDIKKIVSSKDDKLSCPYCARPSDKKLNRGRECFHEGGIHNVKLMFFSSEILLNADDARDYSVFVNMLWSQLTKEETVKALDFNKKVSRAFEIPLNILHKDRLDVYMLSPRKCIVKKDFYFWQYRLIDKFISQDTFAGYCRLCGAKKLKVLSREPGYDFTAPYTMSFENILAEMNGHTKQPEFKVQLAWCETCREYSFVFGRHAFKDFSEYFSGRGFCSNCYSSSEWKNKDAMSLQCPECSHVTPIYERQVVQKAAQTIKII